MNIATVFPAKRSARFVAAACLAAIATSAQAEIDVVTNLMAGQHYVAGTVSCVSADDIAGQCTYTMAPGSDW